MRQFRVSRACHFYVSSNAQWSQAEYRRAYRSRADQLDSVALAARDAVLCGRGPVRAALGTHGLSGEIFRAVRQDRGFTRYSCHACPSRRAPAFPGVGWTGILCWTTGGLANEQCTLSHRGACQCDRSGTLARVSGATALSRYPAQARQTAQHSAAQCTLGAGTVRQAPRARPGTLGTTLWSLTWISLSIARCSAACSDFQNRVVR